MRIFFKIVASILVFFVTLLVVAAISDVYFGKRLPALVNLITLTFFVPFLLVYWRRQIFSFLRSRDHIEGLEEKKAEIIGHSRKAPLPVL